MRTFSKSLQALIYTFSVLFTSPLWAQSQPNTQQKSEKANLNRPQIKTTDGNFVIRPNLLLQPIIGIPLDKETKLVGEGSGLQMKRANLGARGSLFKIASYRLWIGFGKGTAKLIDAWIDLNPWNDIIVIRAGWFVQRFGRQRLSSASKLQFVEPALAWSDKQLGLNLNRDMGISLRGMIAKSVEWDVGVFNGENKYTLDNNRDFSTAARLVFHPLGALGIGDVLTPSDMTTVKETNRPALAVGGSFMAERRRDRSVSLNNTTEPTSYRDAQFKVAAEVGFRWSRLNLTSELFWMKTVLDDTLDATIVSAVKNQSHSGDTHGSGMGMYIQTGVMVVADLLEIAGRFDWVDEHRGTHGSRIYPAFATNLYIKGHNLKLQGFYRTGISTKYDKSHPNWQHTPSHLIELMLQLCY